MTRRELLRTVLAAMGFMVAPLPVPVPPITFKGIPLEFDDVGGPYYLTVHGIYQLTMNSPRRLGVITGIS